MIGWTVICTVSPCRFIAARTESIEFDPSGTVLLDGLQGIAPRPTSNAPQANVFFGISPGAAGGATASFPITWPFIVDGLVFSLSLLAFLTVHEFGHYFAARYHRVKTSLPYYIPSPLIGIGTLGAVIRIREPIPSLRKLFDIGAAGPLVIAATRGSTDGVMRGGALIVSNTLSNYTEPRFKFFSSVVGSVVPFELHYQLVGGTTWL